MSFLDFFAIIILLVLIAFAVVIWVVLGMLPGKIAKSRNHPQATAINVCGWWGVITLGLLLPVAYIWAYYDPRWREHGDGTNLGHGETTSQARSAKEEDR